jgi:hypothetical protein
MTNRRDEFTPYWLQTAVPFGAAQLPPWLSVRIPRPAPDDLEGSRDGEATPASAEPTGGARGLLYSYSQPDDPRFRQAAPSIWNSSPWGTSAQPPGASHGMPGSLPPWQTVRFDPPPSDAAASDEPAPQPRNRFDAWDLGKSFGIGLVNGAIGVPGILGDARELFARGAGQLADYFAPGYGPAVSTAVSRGMRLVPNMGGPSSSDVRGLIEPVTGPFYQPQTVAGDYARTVGEFVPGMAAPGGWARNAVRYTVLPALASEPPASGHREQGRSHGHVPSLRSRLAAPALRSAICPAGHAPDQQRSEC